MRRFVIADQQGARDGVVGEVLFAVERLHGEFECSLRPRLRRERTAVPPAGGRRGPKVTWCSASILLPSRTSERGLLARVAVLREGDGGGYTRVGERLFRDTHIFDLDVVRELFATESDGVHGKTAIAQGLQRVRRDARAAEAGVFWPPSLSSTTAPTGRSDVSATSCFRPSSMRVAVPVGVMPCVLSTRLRSLSRR